MTILFLILIILASAILGFIILVQNPKGGGLASNVGSFGNQFMGVKQTTDVLEKGTWIFGSALAILCIISVLFISNASTGNENKVLQDINTSTVPTQQVPSNSQQQAAPSTLQLPDSTK